MFASRFAFGSVATCILGCTLIFGQIKSGTITGSVEDTSGARIPGAEVSVVDQGTNRLIQVLTNDRGEYAVPYLSQGIYTVTVSLSGFSTSKRTDIRVDTAQTVRVDVVLQVGEIGTTVEVRSETVQLQTEAATVQNAVDERLIQAVPNINRNPFYYASLQAGVVPRSGFNDTQSVNSFGIGIDARRNFSALSVNGGQAFTNDIVLDGVSVQGSAWNEAAVLPNPEGIQEVRTLINNFSAEYGRAQGVITVTTRSGTNGFHGSGFYRNRNEAFNANSFGNNARGISRPAFKVNSYGGTFGGPIREDKAFFFASYEGLLHNRAIDYLRTVPTALEQAGDFSRTFVNVNSVPTPLKIYDPYDVTQTGANEYRRAEIPNAIIPRPDPFALKLMSFYPLPNRTPEDDYGTNNFFLRGIQRFNKNSVNSRLDYRLGGHSIYGTFGVFQGTIKTPSSWGEDNPFYSRGDFVGNLITDRNPYGSIGDTLALTPTLILDMRYGINRINANNEAAVFPDFDYVQFGIPRDLVGINAVPGAPIEFGPGNNLSPLNRTNSLHKRERQTNHQAVAGATKTINRWTLRFGSEYRVYLSNYTDAEESFQIQTSSAFTRQVVNSTGGAAGPAVTADAAGWGPAALLLGAGNIHVAEGRGAKPALAQKYFALYSQNDWRVSDRLTVNLGLRWDVQPAPTDRHDKLSMFDFNTRNPFGTPGAFLFAGADGTERNLWRTHYKDFGPRVGLAYRVGSDVVIRAGYGLSYLPTNTGYFDGPFAYGMASFSSFTTWDHFGATPAGRVVGRYYEVNRVIPPAGSDLLNPGLYGGGEPRFDLDYKNGTVQQWNLFVEKRLGSDWLVSVGYAASKGDKLPYARVPLNSTQFVPSSLIESFRAGYIADNGRSNPANDQVPNPFQPETGPLIPFKGSLGRRTISRLEAALPYPHFGTVQLQRSIGFSSYHALQLQVNRRFASDLQFNAHYTWSKALDFNLTEAQTNGFADSGGYDSSIDQLNYRNNKKVSLTDLPHRFLISFLYELPFGSGKRFNLNSPVVRGIISGWRLSGVGNLQSGYPIQLSGASSTLNNRPDRLPGVDVKVPEALQRWYDGRTAVTLPSGRQITPCSFCYLLYDPDAFSGRVVATPDGSIVPDVYWLGNAAVTYGDIRGAGRNNWNLSIERTFKAGEHVAIDLSAQFTNVWNQTQFRPAMQGGLGATIGSVDVIRSPQLNLKPGQLSNQSYGTRGNATFDPRQVEFQLKARF